MDIIFKEQMGKNVEVYVDDMVVKSLSPNQHTPNLDEIFMLRIFRVGKCNHVSK